MAIDAQQLFSDQRNNGFCVFCGAQPASRDHIPSKILLDEPYPSDLAVVSSCDPCNNGFSLDEEYVACLVECALTGSATPEGVNRAKIKRILGARPELATRIQLGCSKNLLGTQVWAVEHERVRRIILKLARGHVAHELSEPRLEEPSSVSYLPLNSLSPQQREYFESAPIKAGHFGGWPEIGSRAFIKAVVGGASGWNFVQPDRYRFSATWSGKTTVRIVLSEYLACEVTWD